MRVLCAGSAGFCPGVSLALKRLDELIEQKAQSEDHVAAQGRIITLGPIIHNPLVIKHYQEKGVECHSEPLDLGPHDTVVIRAHGIPRHVEENLRQSGSAIVDATCPKVKKAQLAIARESAEGGSLLLFGEKEHPEVSGLLSYAQPGSFVFGTLDELEAHKFSSATPYFLASQTTQERTVFYKAHAYLESILQHKITLLDTICDATRKRQQEVLDMSSRIDAMVVVGGMNSGNTRRLAEVARKQFVPTIHVEQIQDIPADFLQKLARAKSIGLTAGASTPDSHIKKMQNFLTDLT